MKLLLPVGGFTIRVFYRLARVNLGSSGRIYERVSKPKHLIFEVGRMFGFAVTDVNCFLKYLRLFNIPE